MSSTKVDQHQVPGHVQQVVLGAPMTLKTVFRWQAVGRRVRWWYGDGVVANNDSKSLE